MLENIIQGIINVINSSIYWICMYMALGGEIAYLIGFKKGIRLTIASIVIFVFIKMLL